MYNSSKEVPSKTCYTAKDFERALNEHNVERVEEIVNGSSREWMLEVIGHLSSYTSLLKFITYEYKTNLAKKLKLQYISYLQKLIPSNDFFGHAIYDLASIEESFKMAADDVTIHKIFSLSYFYISQAMMAEHNIETALSIAGFLNEKGFLDYAIFFAYSGCFATAKVNDSMFKLVLKDPLKYFSLLIPSLKFLSQSTFLQFDFVIKIISFVEENSLANLELGGDDYHKLSNYIFKTLYNLCKTDQQRLQVVTTFPHVGNIFDKIILTRTAKALGSKIACESKDPVTIKINFTFTPSATLNEKQDLINLQKLMPSNDEKKLDNFVAHDTSNEPLDPLCCTVAHKGNYDYLYKKYMMSEGLTSYINYLNVLDSRNEPFAVAIPEALLKEFFKQYPGLLSKVISHSYIALTERLLAILRSFPKNEQQVYLMFDQGPICKNSLEVAIETYQDEIALRLYSHIINKHTVDDLFPKALKHGCILLAQVILDNRTKQPLDDFLEPMAIYFITSSALVLNNKNKKTFLEFVIHSPLCNSFSMRLAQRYITARLIKSSKADLATMNCFERSLDNHNYLVIQLMLHSATDVSAFTTLMIKKHLNSDMTMLSLRAMPDLIYTLENPIQESPAIRMIDWLEENFIRPHPQVGAHFLQIVFDILQHAAPLIRSSPKIIRGVVIVCGAFEDVILKGNFADPLLSLLMLLLNLDIVREVSLVNIKPEKQLSYLIMQIVQVANYCVHLPIELIALLRNRLGKSSSPMLKLIHLTNKKELVFTRLKDYLLNLMSSPEKEEIKSLFELGLRHMANMGQASIKKIDQLVLTTKMETDLAMGLIKEIENIHSSMLLNILITKESTIIKLSQQDTNFYSIFQNTLRTKIQKNCSIAYSTQLLTLLDRIKQKSSAKEDVLTQKDYEIIYDYARSHDNLPLFINLYNNKADLLGIVPEQLLKELLFKSKSLILTYLLKSFGKKLLPDVYQEELLTCLIDSENVSNLILFTNHVKVDEKVMHKALIYALAQGRSRCADNLLPPLLNNRILDDAARYATPELFKRILTRMRDNDCYQFTYEHVETRCGGDIDKLTIISQARDQDRLIANDKGAHKFRSRIKEKSKKPSGQDLFNDFNHYIAILMAYAARVSSLTKEDYSACHAHLRTAINEYRLCSKKNIEHCNPNTYKTYWANIVINLDKLTTDPILEENTIKVFLEVLYSLKGINQDATQDYNPITTAEPAVTNAKPSLVAKQKSPKLFKNKIDPCSERMTLPIKGELPQSVTVYKKDFQETPKIVVNTNLSDPEEHSIPASLTEISPEETLNIIIANIAKIKELAHTMDTLTEQAVVFPDQCYPDFLRLFAELKQQFWILSDDLSEHGKLYRLVAPIQALNVYASFSQELKEQITLLVKSILLITEDIISSDEIVATIQGPTKSARLHYTPAQILEDYSRFGSDRFRELQQLISNPQQHELIHFTLFRLMNVLAFNRSAKLIRAFLIHHFELIEPQELIAFAQLLLSSNFNLIDKKSYVILDKSPLYKKSLFFLEEGIPTGKDLPPAIGLLCLKQLKEALLQSDTPRVLWAIIRFGELAKRKNVGTSMGLTAQTIASCKLIRNISCHENHKLTLEQGDGHNSICTISSSEIYTTGNAILIDCGQASPQKGLTDSKSPVAAPPAAPVVANNAPSFFNPVLNLAGEKQAQHPSSQMKHSRF